jgi:general secretion pathway protein K
MTANSGIALIGVMIALMVLSAIALGLSTSVQMEARITAADWDGLQAEQLARSGQEFAAFLELRGIRKTSDFLTGLPFDAITPGFHYRSHLRTGDVDVYFEADNGKLDLSAAPEEVLTNFFTMWTGDLTKAQLITAAVEDWRDPDDQVRPNGAEAPYYAPLNYAPRNGPLGIADAPLVRGLGIDDFRWKALRENEAPVLSGGLDQYVTSAVTGGMINANFALESLLRAVPGLNDSQVSTILSSRVDRPFDDMHDLQVRIGLAPDSPALKYLVTTRSGASVSSIATLKTAARLRRSERRVMYSFSGLNFASGLIETKLALGRVQRGMVPVYLEGPS